MSFFSDDYGNSYVKIDGIGDIQTTPSQQTKTITDGNNTSTKMLFTDMHCPYPVKKGQEVTFNLEFLFLSFATIRYAPCMSI